MSSTRRPEAKDHVQSLYMSANLELTIFRHCGCLCKSRADLCILPAANLRWRSMGASIQENNAN